jgi:hypothetical protein
MVTRVGCVTDRVCSARADPGADLMAQGLRGREPSTSDGPSTLGPLRAYAEIARRREQNQGAELLEQLLWRIEVLGGDVDLLNAENRAAFAEVFDAYLPETHRLVLLATQPCRATRNASGAEVVFTGYLVSGENITAELERRLDLIRRVAHHRRFRVLAPFRGNGIAPRSLVRCVELYDSLGFTQIKLRAAHSGTWYWAQWGFHFDDQNELARVQDHAQAIIDAFGSGLDASTLTHPVQFALLGESSVLSFDELADAFPHRRDAYEQIAYDNGIGIHDKIPFGRVVLLTGPTWDGCLDLDPDGADRIIFNDRAHRLRVVKGGAP